MHCPNHLYNSRQSVISAARVHSFLCCEGQQTFWKKINFPFFNFLSVPSQGCLEIGKLHKCKFKTWPDKLCLLVPLIIFYSHFTAISKNFTTSFVNYISIKIPLRGRYNNAVFVILLQQRKAHFLLTANAQHIETLKGGGGEACS